MKRISIKFRLSPRDTEEYISINDNGLSLPWQETDTMSANCPKHAGVRLNRVGDETYECPLGKEIYRPHGSVTNQNVKDNYYTGMIIKNNG
jgi:hypothetical protein